MLLKNLHLTDKVKNSSALILISIFLLSSCQDVERSEKPKNLIPEDKMVEVLTDLSILYSARNFNKRFLESAGFRPSTYLFEKYGIDSLQFERSNNYYSENYTVYERIYSRVKDSLEKLKTEYEIISEEEMRVKDSISAAGNNEVIDSLSRTGKVIDSVKLDSMKSRSGNHIVPKDSLIAPPNNDLDN